MLLRLSSDSGRSMSESCRTTVGAQSEKYRFWSGVGWEYLTRKRRGNAKGLNGFDNFTNPIGFGMSGPDAGMESPGTSCLFEGGTTEQAPGQHVLTQEISHSSTPANPKVRKDSSGH